MTRRSCAGRRSGCSRGSGAGSAADTRSSATTACAACTTRGSNRVPAAFSSSTSASAWLSCGPPRGGQRAPGVRHRDDPRGHRRHRAAQAGGAAAAVPPLADVAGLPARAARVAQRLAGVGDRVAGLGAALEGELGHAREVAALVAVEPEVQRQRVRVAARRGQRVERRDRAGARGVGQRALRQDRDQREERRARATPIQPTSTQVTRAQEHHHAARRGRRRRTSAERGERRAEPERDVDGGADRDVDEHLRRRASAATAAARRRAGSRRRRASRTRPRRSPSSRMRRGSRGCRRAEGFAAHEGADDDDRDDVDHERRQPGPPTASAISASGMPASKLMPADSGTSWKSRDDGQRDQQHASSQGRSQCEPAPAR